MSNTRPSLDAQSGLEHELEETLSSFQDIQTELNYRQAQDVLRELVDGVDLSSREQAGLQVEIDSLRSLLHKLDTLTVQIAVFGMVGRGKSSLLNALLGQTVFQTGAVHGVTQDVQAAQWSVRREAIAGLEDAPGVPSNHAILRASLPGIGTSQVELIDTPGIDEVDGEYRERLARQVAQQADLILFVVSGDITRVEFEALSQLRQASKPILLVFNKVDQYPDADRLAIYQKIRDERVRELLSPDEIVMAAASPLTTQAMRRPDGSLRVRRLADAPQVDDLKLKILEVLHREGKALVALNTMLYAGNLNERLVQRKMAIRDRAANQVIWNGVMTKSVAIALNPVTVLDLLSGAVVDIALIVTLSKLYGIAITQQGALDLLRKIALSLGGVTATELVATLGLGSLKSLLGLSAPATAGMSLVPYATVALAQGSVAGVSTYAIGQVTKTYLANGASWGPNGPKAVVNQILESLDEESILNRVKEELKQKLQPEELDRMQDRSR